jgi:hypothetical protein
MRLALKVFAALVGIGFATWDLGDVRVPAGR